MFHQALKQQPLCINTVKSVQEVGKVGYIFMSPRWKEKLTAVPGLEKLACRREHRGWGTASAAKTEKVRKGKPAGGVTTVLLSMFTCQVSMVSQIAIPVFSARLRHRRQASKEPALHWCRDTRAVRHRSTRTHTCTEWSSLSAVVNVLFEYEYEKTHTNTTAVLQKNY